MSELRVAVAGCPFVVSPIERLAEDELAALQRLATDADGGREFHVTITDNPLPETVAPPSEGNPALITTEGELVRVAHERFTGIIDPASYTAQLHRRDTRDAFGLEILLRTALSCRLPLESGLLLHSAGIVIDESAAVFYGVSGAGKSTLSSFMPAVLSDELVALRSNERGFSARATGFWGTLDEVDAPAGAYPLRATVELARAEGVTLTPLSTRDARRALMLVAVVPPQPLLWHSALRVIDALSRLPAFRLAWTPNEENAREVIAQTKTAASF